VQKIGKWKETIAANRQLLNSIMEVFFSLPTAELLPFIVRELSDMVVSA